MLRAVLTDLHNYFPGDITSKPILGNFGVTPSTDPAQIFGRLDLVNLQTTYNANPYSHTNKKVNINGQ